MNAGGVCVVAHDRNYHGAVRNAGKRKFFRARHDPGRERSVADAVGRVALRKDEVFAREDFFRINVLQRHSAVQKGYFHLFFSAHGKGARQRETMSITDRIFPAVLICRAPFINFYASIFSMNRLITAAFSARVALSCGANAPFSRPKIMPRELQ